MENSHASGSADMEVDIPADSVVNGMFEKPSLPTLSVGYVYSAEMMMHAPPIPQGVEHDGHPEKPERIEKIHALLVAHQLHFQMKPITIREVRREEALLVHSEAHWNKVMALQELTDEQRIDTAAFYELLSLYVSPGTTRAALLSCGGVIEASLAVVRGEFRKTFAIVRPPGHHAEPEEHMGFCFFNNVAVAAKVVQQITRIKRILILDWDVHHGNGTQRAFNSDPSVLYISIHRYENGTFYPCGDFGSMESSGDGDGKGFSVNIPWPERGMGDAEYIHAFQKVVMPIAMEFAPELVIISAGFDAAAGDDLGGCLVTPIGYAHMTHMLSGLAGGKVVVALEGGYNVDAISKSALAVTKVLLGEPPQELPPMVANEVATETVWQVAREQSKYWKSVDPRACEPSDENPPSATFTIPEILKAHRQHYMYTEHGMLQVPLMTPELEEKFGSQVMCTPDIMENKTLVVIVHEFGNLRLELANALTCDVNLERSYLIDASKLLVNWVRKQEYALLDVNLFPKRKGRNKNVAEDLKRDVLTYLWDNYIQLTSPHQVILVGHGPGCIPIMELLRSRTDGVMSLVKGVVQIMGSTGKPLHPKVAAKMQDVGPLKAWFRARSMLIHPRGHPSFVPDFRDAKHHSVVVCGETSGPVRLLANSVPLIELWIQTQLQQEKK